MVIRSMKDWRFRRAGAEDHEVVSDLSRKAYLPAYVPVIGAVPRPAVEEYTGWIAQGLVWLATDGEAAAGVLVLEKHDGFLKVWSLAVDPSLQHRGLGKAMLRLAEDIARRWGETELRLHTNTRMAADIALSRKASFREIAVTPHPSRAGHELVHMAKMVTDPDEPPAP